MKQNKKDLITVSLFCGFLAAMTALYFLLPKQTFSENEKRFLSEFPAPEWDAVSSGDWGEDVETYLADHIPGRDLFVGLNAYFELYTGRQAGKDVLLSGDRILEAPVKADDAAIQRNLTAIHTLAETTGRQLDLMIIPSAGWASGKSGYTDSAIIQQIYDAAGSSLVPVDVLEVFEGRPDLYFRTDHHWTSAGAYAAYSHLMALKGRTYPEKDLFTVEHACEFRGSTYSRSALWLTPGEPLEIWHGSGDLTVVNAETEGTHQGVFYRERLEEADKYTVFLDGNHSLVRVHNPNGQGRILVIRDSYSNLLGCFLAESYEEVVLVDLRYYKQPVSQLMTEEAFDDVLVFYSLGNFMTDTNLIWLR